MYVLFIQQMLLVVLLKIENYPMIDSDNDNKTRIISNIREFYEISFINVKPNR